MKIAYNLWKVVGIAYTQHKHLYVKLFIQTKLKHAFYTVIQLWKTRNTKKKVTRLKWW
jgi:hypothetical protein